MSSDLWFLASSRGEALEMIERKILYYPTILVPSRWLKWATLYWDKTSSIVPSGWEDTSSFVHPPNDDDYRTMNHLWEEGLFEPTRPDSFWKKTRQLRRALGDEFDEALYSPGFQTQINRNWHRNPTNRVHQDKLSERILEHLRHSKLARVDRKNPSWLLVEENTSLLYMGLLAKHLADADAEFLW